MIIGILGARIGRTLRAHDHRVRYRRPMFRAHCETKFISLMHFVTNERLDRRAPTYLSQTSQCHYGT
jgi:hypothetical protein